MAKNKKKAKSTDDIVMDAMPGGEVKTEKDIESFQVDLNFEDEAAPEEAVAEVEETTEEVAEEPVAEEAVEEPVAEEEAVAETEEPVAEEDTVEFPAEEVVEEEVVAEKPKAPMVPKSRLDEVLAKNKKMQKRIEEIEQKEAEAKEAAPTYDFDLKEQEYQQLILDGESAKAVELRNEIRKAEKDALMFDIQRQMGQTVQQNQAQQELQAKAAEIASTFSILDENSAEFNEEITREVMDLRDAFIVQGYEPADSLAKATEYTLAAKQPELLRPAEAKVATQSKEIAQKKQKANVKNKIAASKAQPPTLKGESASARGDKVTDINTLSDDEFGALPEETVRRLRGDFG
tara:strand:- start:12839 stop:13879 length:1041 start_codon:yes stop_codon:yes gene_type:complete